MPRPLKRRRVCQNPIYRELIVSNSNSEEVINLSIDEYECLRLLDYEKITQEECAIKMMVARTTVTSIYQEARFKIMDAIINGKKIVINGGNYFLCPEHNKCNGYDCININIIERKGEIKMRIAVTYENNEIFQHFGRTQQFKIYDINENNEVTSYLLDSNGVGHGALVDLLSKNNVDLLICGGIGNGAINAFNESNIKVLSGASGNCDEIINKLLMKKLDLDNRPNCNHHHDEHHECHCGNDHHHHHDHDCNCHK